MLQSVAPSMNPMHCVFVVRDWVSHPIMTLSAIVAAGGVMNLHAGGCCIVCLAFWMHIDAVWWGHDGAEALHGSCEQLAGRRI